MSPDAELIRETLARFDPETRMQVIEAAKALRALPVPVAVRILAGAASSPRPSLLICPG